MFRYGMKHIDILKIDIEGAEKTVLDEDPGWLGNVGVLAGELHDGLDSDCSRVLSNVTRRFDVHWEQGEN